MKKYPLARPHLGKEEERAVLKVLRSKVLSLGPELIKFEKTFAKQIGATYACAVNSGTSGLHLAMIAAGIKAGDEVITTPFSFVASANAILYVGAKPVFVDIEPVTYNIDPKKIEAAITKKTKAILVVHIFGQAANMGPIMKIAKQHQLIVVEDACESIKATYKGKPTGTFGQSGVFAFYPNKQMTTGEGGMVVTNDKTVYDVCKSLSNQGRGVNMNWLDHQYLGYNYRLDEMSAALGLVQLKKLNMLIKDRQKIANTYTRFLQGYPELLQVPLVAKDNTHTWFVYVVTIKNKKVSRDQVMADLAKAGISSKAYLPSIHLFGFYKKSFGFKKGDFPISESVSDYSLALPLYSDLTSKDIAHICSQLISILERYEF